MTDKLLQRARRFAEIECEAVIFPPPGMMGALVARIEALETALATANRKLEQASDRVLEEEAKR